MILILWMLNEITVLKKNLILRDLLVYCLNCRNALWPLLLAINIFSKAQVAIRLSEVSDLL